MLIALRAFSQGCTAWTGVEAVSNGVPNFKPPKARNAATTLAAMGAVTIAMFAGITALALIAQVRLADDPSMLVGASSGYQQRTAIAQVAGAVFGYDSVFFFLVQAFTAAVLVLAANTAFNGFPILASILGRDGYLPRQFGRRGDRLVFSNGIIILAVLAGLLIWGFDASTSRLIQLDIIGVFVSFTPSQAGMVRYWTTVLRSGGSESRARIQRARLINAGGAILTAVVVGHPWEQLLHNQSALRLKARLLFEPGVLVTSVPWQLQSSGRSDVRTADLQEELVKPVEPETARSLAGS